MAFSRVVEGSVAAVTDNIIVYFLTACDSALPGFETPEERFHLVVGPRQTLNLVASEQTPPTVAEGLVDMAGYLLVEIVTGQVDRGDQVDQIAVHPVSNF
jgi:hypothetical protein